jgi:hypothetical protein
MAYTKQSGVPGWTWRGPKAGKKERLVYFDRLHISHFD